MIDKDGNLVWDNEIVPSTDFPTLMDMEEPENEIEHVLAKKRPNDLEEISAASELLKEKYPRIYERIEATWGSPELDSYFDRLIIDDRGNRNGFPKEVLNALLLLAKSNRKELPKNTTINKNKWEQTGYK